MKILEENRPWWKSKTIMTVAAAVSVVLLWLIMIVNLYFLKAEAMSAFQAISLYAFSAFALIVCWGIGMKNIDRIFSMKTEAMMMATTSAQSIVESISKKEDINIKEEYIEKRIIDDDKEDSPKQRPFSKIDDIE